MMNKSTKDESSKSSSEEFAAAINDMDINQKAAIGLLIKRLSGSIISDEDYLKENFPDVDADKAKQMLQEYEEYKGGK